MSSTPFQIAPPADRAPGGPAEIDVPGGSFVLGSVHEPWAYDNELDAARDRASPVSIDRAPVTNGQFARFVRKKRVSIEEAVERGRLGLARARGRQRSALLGDGQRGLGARALRPARARPGQRACATCLVVRSRCVRALGGKAPTDGDRMGARGRLARSRGEVPLPLGTGVDGLRGQPRPRSLLPRSGRVVSRRQ